MQETTQTTGPYQSKSPPTVSVEQIQQDIQTLSPKALNVLYQFIQLLKKTSAAASENPPTATPSGSTDTMN